jgi:uncharacterized protein (TIGR00251 family)
MALPPYILAHGNGATILLQIQPRASRSEVVGEHGGRLRLRIASPPVDGKANAEVCRFLAAALGLGRGTVTLLRGETSRQKQVAVPGLTPAEVAHRLAAGAAHG